MARPPKKGLDYFPHDTSAVYDEKIQVLRMMYGNDGYAAYFILLEHIYRKGGELELTSELKILLSGLLKINQGEFEKIINYCIDLGLFDKSYYQEKNTLTSERIKRMVGEISKRKKIKLEEPELIKNPDNDSERLINAMLSIVGRLPTMYERNELETLIKEYGIDELINSFKLAKEQNKFSIAYIKGILKSKNKIKIIEEKLRGENGD